MNDEAKEREENLAAMRRQEQIKAELKNLFGSLSMLDVRFSGTAVVKRAGQIIEQLEEEM